MSNKGAGSHQEAGLVRLAERQHGIVTRHQLVAAGLLPSAITCRVQAGRLHRLHRGVYALGRPTVSRHGRWLAGVLTCGEGAVLSHRAAASLWGIRNWSGYPEVTVPGDGGRRERPNLIVHRSTTLTPRETTTKQAIPVTAPSRTLADLRRIIAGDQYRAALRQAEILRLDTGPQPGYEPEQDATKLERAFRRLCRRHRLPMPESQVIIGPYTVDFLWAQRRLVVETDGWGTHGIRSAFEADRERDAELRRMGYEVLRFSHRQVTRQAPTVAATLRTAVATGPPPSMR